MPDYFVWLRPSLAQVIEAVSEQDAAEAFLEMPTTGTPQPGLPPDKRFHHSAFRRNRREVLGSDRRRLGIVIIVDGNGGGVEVRLGGANEGRGLAA